MALLTEHNMIQLMKFFPNVELSYETMTHKKVYDADFLVAIPEGNKYFAWFYTFHNKPVCYLMETTSKKQILSIQMIYMNNNSNNTNNFKNLNNGTGTIFYGTLIHHKNKKLIFIEDIFYYKGNYLNQNTQQKLELLNEIFKSEALYQLPLDQVPLENNKLHFGLPLLSTNFNELLGKIESLPYPIQHIQYRYYAKNSRTRIFCLKYMKPSRHFFQNNQHSQNNKNNHPVKNKSSTSQCLFKVKADIQTDIYKLYCTSKNTGINGGDYFYDNAYIPDYKTSVMMNQIFRKIKENANLDAIEESDSEDEFESEKIDKFVDLNKEVNMTCVYHYKFKRWVPKKIEYLTTLSIVDISDLRQ